MNILIVSSYLPYPLYSGGQVRLYNLIKELSHLYTITLVCERRPNETDDDVHEVEKICHKVITVKRKKQWSFSNLVKATSSSKSFLSTGHDLPEMRAVLKNLLKEKNFNVIHVETYYVMQNIPETSIPIVLVEHNIEYKVYERYMNNAPIFLRPLLSLDIQKIKNEEEFLWRKAQKVVAVSNDDTIIMKKSGIHAEVVSNGVNIDQFSFLSFQKRDRKEKRILFIGDFKWIQNKDSATFIIQDIWPILKKKLSEDNVKLWFVARSIPDSIRNLTNDPDVLFDEESSAMQTPEIFQKAAVLLAPIRVGGGTSYKILESMSCGTPVITMPLSADALEAKDGKELLVGNDAESLADETLKVLKDENLYNSVSKNGREFIEKNYTWKQISKKLHAVYSDTTKSV